MENYLGVLQDIRTDDKKALDYKHSDLAGALPVIWQEKDLNDWNVYRQRKQDGSLSCVAQSCAKAMEVLGFGVESAHPIYIARANYPGGGMWLGDAGTIARKKGTTKEELDVSQNLGEQALNLPCDKETPDKIGGYVFVNSKNIDEIAQAIELQGHCILTFHANGNEWTSVPEYNGREINFGHAVCAVDYFLFDGEKCILIEDSALNNNTYDLEQERIITEDYLKARCSAGMYFVPKPIIPPYKFTRTLRVGSVGTDVKMLQIRLGIGADGLFGKITKAAVIKFQLSHNLVGDGIVGPLTINTLNND